MALLKSARNSMVSQSEKPFFLKTLFCLCRKHFFRQKMEQNNQFIVKIEKCQSL